jgi:GxxExxY protein
MFTMNSDSVSLNLCTVSLFNWRLREKNLKVEAEVAVPVFFRGINVGDFRADLVVNDSVLLELKTAESIIIAHEAQLLNYLRATALEIGLILNFSPKSQVRRLLFDNNRKLARVQRIGGAM